jgi:hypothetical protein
VKKSVSIIVLFIFLFDIEGYYLWFSIQQKLLQNKIEQEIEDKCKTESDALIIVPIHDESGIIWIKPNKEFCSNGSMYDVVSTKVLNGKKYYYCINDTREKQLVDSYHKKNNTKKEAEKKLRRAFVYQYSGQQINWTVDIGSSDFCYVTITSLFKSNSIDVNSPPPKLI